MRVCSNCGSQNADEVRFCTRCGNDLLSSAPPAPPQHPGTLPGAGGPGMMGYGMPGPKPPNYLVWSILVTLFCCLVGGIAAIVYSAQVDGKYNKGDYAGALESSRKAKMWCWISFGVGLPIQIVYIAINIAAADL